MLARSARFDDAVINGGTAISRMDSLRGGITQVTDIPIAAGSITVDRASSARRTLSVTVPDEDGTLTPKVPTDPLSPYANELQVYTGFRYADGSEELLPVGRFRIEETTPTNEGVIEISGIDRSYVIAQSRFEVPFLIASGTNTITAIQSILNSRFPGLIYNAVSTIRTTPLTVFEEGDSKDPWGAVQDIAQADGLDVFFSPLGVVNVIFEPDPTIDPVVWSHLADANSIVTHVANKQSTVNAYNIAIVSGEGTENVTPVRATKEVTDALSPIFPAVFGRRPVFLVSSFITTFQQAQDAANALLQRKAGGSEELTFTAVPHPAHEAGDVVRVINTRLGIDTFAVIKSFSLDLTLQQASTYSTYARRRIV
ncbi:MAG: DUF5047 domain-containing protein [Actinomycetota bacterium]